MQRQVWRSAAPGGPGFHACIPAAAEPACNPSWRWAGSPRRAGRDLPFSSRRLPSPPYSEPSPWHLMLASMPRAGLPSVGSKTRSVWRRPRVAPRISAEPGHPKIFALGESMLTRNDADLDGCSSLAYPLQVCSAAPEAHQHTSHPRPWENCRLFDMETTVGQVRRGYAPRKEDATPCQGSLPWMR